GFVKRTPDLELVLRLGKKAAAEPGLEVVTGSGRSPLAGQVRLKEDLALLDLVRTRAELRGNDQERPDRLGGIVRQQYLAQFKQADTNGDGFLDAREADNSRAFRGLFKVLDRDRNGKVSEKEWIAYLDHVQEMQKRAVAACV